ncbi:MAG: DNA mismatch repair endonuclease MutL [Alloprevotella sp.]
MSDIIQLLPDSVANQIAAGEVIQRPASIVKELTENSLDAGATQIQVRVEDAGKSLVQVIDNGKGMSGTDARMAFERHATSKIRQATDLFSLRTMGFRGEALASIAAVAQVELRTRTPQQEVGTSIRIEGSRVVSVEPVATPVGANFAVRNLFFNIPARRKFLKSNQTELGHIMTEFERIVLANPEVSFSLHSDDALLLSLPAANFRRRIVSLFGKRVDAGLVPVETETTLVKVRGFVGTPDSARRKGARQFFFANGRFMRHPYFAKAIQSAYERLIPEGFQPTFFLTLEVDPSRLDVNIHPTKTEIKFEDDNAIFQILLAAVRESLGKFGAVPSIDFDAEGKPDIPNFPQSAEAFSGIEAPKISIDPNFNPFRSFSSSGSASSSSFGGASSFKPASSPAFAPPAADSAEDEFIWSSATNEKSEPSADGSAPAASIVVTDDQFLQYAGTYILTPLPSGLAMIDQHRAHIRILYELYQNELSGRPAASQRLLFPEMIRVSPSEAVVLDGMLPSMQKIGFDLSPLGGGSYSLLAVPSGTEGLSPVALVEGILSDAVHGEANPGDAVTHVLALSLARKVAVPTGQELSAPEMRTMVEQLFACTTPQFTPDGKPTLIVLGNERIESLFGK